MATPFTEMQKTGEEEVFGSVGRNQLLCFGEVKSETFTRHPCGDTDQASDT